MSSRVERMFGPRENWGKGDEMAAVRERAVRQEGGGQGRDTRPRVSGHRRSGVPTEKAVGEKKTGGNPVKKDVGGGLRAAPDKHRSKTGNGTQAVPYGRDGAKRAAGEKKAVKGFVSIKCPECGKVHNTCLHEERTIFNCKDCGQPVALEGMRSIKMDCPRCRFKARYLTNRQEKLIQMECLNCSKPVNFRQGYRRGNYVVEGEE